MAKQVGLFGLRGKIENKSFYKTAGVQDTVIRQIPEGLGSRVKTADEYANTRLNNAEFKNANSIATAAFNSVNTRKKGMMRRFAIASMTKKALEDIKIGTGNWGARHPSTELDVLICDLLENHAKGGAYNGEYGALEIMPLDDTGEGEIDFKLSESLINNLKSLGIDGIQVIVSRCLAGEIDVDGQPRLYAGSALSVHAPYEFPSAGEGSVNAILEFNGYNNVGMSPSGYTFATSDPKHGYFAVATILPFRKHGNKLYTLQEMCTYVAVPFGQIPE